MKIKVQKLHPDAKLPVYSTPGSSAFDLHALTVHGAYQLGANTDHGRPLLCGTGLAFDIPAGHGMLIMSRSGMGFKEGVRLSNCIGLIDSDYRGEVMVQLTQDYLHGQDDFEFIPPFICPGDRIAQAIIIPMPRVEFELCSELPATKRGIAGLGSTGS
jgi:dUTP pyrophosphatase